MLLRRAASQTVALACLLVACKGTSSSSVGAAASTINNPTRSWFEAEKLPGDFGTWSCGGLVDLDGDGALEVVAASGPSVRLFKATASGWQMKDVPLTGVGGTVGCDASDVDGDGKLDLIVTSGQNGAVLLNQGQLSFREVPLPAFPPGPESAFAVAALDVDVAGQPDLFIVRTPSLDTIQAFLNDGCDCREDGSVRCGKQDEEYPGGPNVFLHNKGQGQFEVVQQTGTEGNLINLAAGIYDIDGDGRQDLILGADSAPSHVFRNTGTHTFQDITDALGLKEHHHGMGVAYGDLLGDGTDQLVFSEVGVPLVLARSGDQFQPAEQLEGFLPYAQWGWGTELEDFDNSGRLSLMFVNDPLSVFGFNPGCPGIDFEKVPQAEFLLYRNLGGGRFLAESAVKPGSPLYTLKPNFAGDRPLAVGDIDNDGVLDALVLPRVGSNKHVEPWLLHGRLKEPLNGLTVAAPQGAIVTACVDGKCQHREVGGAHSNGAIHPREVHFGLGHATQAAVSIEWPRGTSHELGMCPAGQRMTWAP